MIENNKALYPIWFIIECVRQIFQCSVDACRFMQQFEFSQAFKRKPKRLFYIKMSGEYIRTFQRDNYSGEVIWFWNKSRDGSREFTEREYDRIKHLLPSDHTLELVNNKK